MTKKLIAPLFLLLFAFPAFSQVPNAAFKPSRDYSVGGGVDYWKGDWGHIARFGPSLWATAELWRGFGLNVEGHSMMAGGGDQAQEFKYYSAKGGVIYFRNFRKVKAYGKGELGYGSLSWPHAQNSTYSHDTRNTWAFGGGVEAPVKGPVWLRADYTYEGFVDLIRHHTLNPTGVTVGFSYHFNKLK